MTASQGFRGALANQVVIAGSGGQLLVYSGTPAAGNLILSISSAAGVDGFGNSFPQGLGISPGSLGSGFNKVSWTIGGATGGLIQSISGVNPLLEIVEPTGGAIQIGTQSTSFLHYEYGIKVPYTLLGGTNSITPTINFNNAFQNVPCVLVTVNVGSFFDHRADVQPQAGVLDLSSFTPRITTPTLANAGANQAGTLNWFAIGV